MKRPFTSNACPGSVLTLLVAGTLSLMPVVSGFAQTAQTRIYCLSLRFQEGTAAGGATLQLTTRAPSEPPNGELAPAFDDPSHYSNFILEVDFFLEPLLGTLFLDVPPSGDANQNGFVDFFEFTQNASGTTTGTYATHLEDGTVEATWNRAAGSRDGTCVLRLTSNQFGHLGDFTHTFELIEYSGPLDYTPGEEAVSGSVELIQSGTETNLLAGPVAFQKSAAMPFDELVLQSGEWTNAPGQTLIFFEDLLTRDFAFPTNYYGFIEFVDGDLSTPDEDYFTWVLSIDDPNDTDENGIPDFSDDPSPAPVNPPSLRLDFDAGNFSLTISGAVGRLLEIQATAALDPPEWNTVDSMTLVRDPQTVELPAPASGQQFWRVRVP